MLGIDWLKSNNLSWNFTYDVVVIGGEQYPVQARRRGQACRQVVVEQDTVVPPHSETNVIGRIELNLLQNGPEGEEWCTENGDIKGSSLIVAHTLVPNELDNIPVRILNKTEKSVFVKAESVLADLETVVPVEKVVDDPTAPKESGYVDKLLERVDVGISDEEKHELKKLLEKYSDVFSTSEYDLGSARYVEHSIDTEAARPCREPWRRQPRDMQEAIDKQVAAMEQAGIIEPSASPWGSNIVMVKKKDESLRFCVDYRKLNALTRKDVYPLPKIEACLDALNGARYFSTFDLRAGYHQVMVKEEDSDKTSFLTRGGSYKFRRMPFGLCNAGSTFQRLMDVVMRGLNFSILLVYLDDIIVYSRTVEEHVERLEKMFLRLRDANLKLKPSKCFLLQAQVTFLGHIVSGSGVATDPEKIEAVQNWPRPVNVREVRSFLGLCSYYRRFVQGFAEIAGPLHAMTKKNCKFDWTVSCEESFGKLKVALTTSPVLTMPDDEGQYILDTDASDTSIGAVLSQVQSGEEKVVAYASRMLSNAEKNYCVTRRELLAVIHYLKQFRVYLLGRKFKIRTDHAALQWLRKTPIPIGQQARWAEQLEEFTFEIEHRPGRKHTNADTMSRRPCRQCGVEPQEEGAEVSEVCEVRAVILNDPENVENSPWNEEEMSKAYAKDEELAEIVRMMKLSSERPPLQEVISRSAATKGYWNQWERLTLKGGLLYRRWRPMGKHPEVLQLVPPMSYRRIVIEKSHEGLTNCHSGLRRTKARVQKKAYWMGWSIDVERFHRSCKVCAKFFRGTPRRQGPMQVAPVGEPWERLAVDITGPHPRSKNGFMYILTAIDMFTRWAFAIPIRKHDAITVAHVLVDKVFSIFGMPAQLLTDRGPEFESGLMRELCRVLEIQKLRTTAYKPSSNGTVERYHRTLNGFLGKVISENQRDWDQWIPAVLAAYHASRHEATGFSPNFLVLGREVRMPLDLVYGAPEEDVEPKTYDEIVMERWTRQREAFELARRHIGRAAERSKQYYDLKVKPKKFDIGDWIWVYNPRRFVGRSPKWQRLYTGPFLVVGKLGAVNLIVQRSSKANKQVIHVDKAKLCSGDTPNCWLSGDDIREVDGSEQSASDNERDQVLVESTPVRPKDGIQNPEEESDGTFEVRRNPQRQLRKPARFRTSCVKVDTERVARGTSIVEQSKEASPMNRAQEKEEVEESEAKKGRPRRDIRKPFHCGKFKADRNMNRVRRGGLLEEGMKRNGWHMQIEEGRIVMLRSATVVEGQLQLLEEGGKVKKKKKQKRVTKTKEEQSEKIEQWNAKLEHETDKDQEKTSKPRLQESIKTYPCLECKSMRPRVFKTRRGLGQHVRTTHRSTQGEVQVQKKLEREILEEQWSQMVRRGALEVTQEPEKNVESVCGEGDNDLDEIEIGSQEWLTHEETDKLIAEAQGVGSYEDLLSAIGL